MIVYTKRYNVSYCKGLLTLTAREVRDFKLKYYYFLYM